MTQQQTRHQSDRFGRHKPHARLLHGTLLAVLLGLVNGTFALGSSVARLRADAPEAVVEITRRDLGEVFAGEEVEYAFIVRNAGTKPLELAEKTSLSSRSPGSELTPSVAMWRAAGQRFARDRLVARPVAATRAAPT